MLPPDKRYLFRDALQPPPGYNFDRGIGTTFTLDLFTLLITPLAISLCELKDTEDALRDPLLLLDSVRRFSKRLTLFCQAGYIRLPHQDNPLFRWLEKMIVEVQAPKGGVFHPKVWLLRFTSEGKPIRYRLLVLSRNLTFDRSWDLILSLDGEVGKNRSMNKPLCDFIGALPKLAVHTPGDQVHENIKLMKAEVGRVKFSPPEGFHQGPHFKPLGIKGYDGYQFSPWISRLLVISPFLSDDLLSNIVQQKGDHTIISREESLDSLSANCVRQYPKTFVLDDMASQGVNDDPGDSAPGTEENNFYRNALAPLSGLHAKLFVADLGWNTLWLIGSANATNAAFQNNVEFMVELWGKKSKVGTEVVLGKSDNQNALINLLLPYKAGENDSEDSKIMIIELLIDRIRRWLVKSKIEITILSRLHGNYDLTLSYSNSNRPKRGLTEIWCWPASLPESNKQFLDPTTPIGEIQFSNLSLTSLTAFFAFEIIAQAGNKKVRNQFILKLPINGLPENRDEVLISEIISNREQFLRYLRLVLSGDYENMVLREPFNGNKKGPTNWNWISEDVPLLEQLVRVLNHDPQRKIDRITEIVEKLQKTERGKEILDVEFSQIWATIQQTREKLS